MFTSGRAVDPLLQEQAKRAWVGFGLGISVLVNGMIVIGQLAQPDRMAEELAGGSAKCSPSKYM